MTLYPNWQKILKKSWAIRFALIAGFFSALEIWNSLMGEQYFSPGVFATVSGACSFLSIVSRTVAQKDI